METLPEIGLIFAFLGGLLSFFSPCVAPLVPGYLSFISGISISTTNVTSQQLAVSNIGQAGVVNLPKGNLSATIDG